LCGLPNPPRRFSAFDVLLALEDLHIGEAGENLALVVDRHFFGGAELRVLRDDGRAKETRAASDRPSLA
jgi:hypothetical protein